MIYVIENIDLKHLKIGCAINPEKRLEAMQIGNSCELRIARQFPGSHSLEAKIHRDLKKYNIRCEWFYANNEVWKYIDAFFDYEYEILNGHDFLVLWRDVESLECDTDFCSFCGERHNHTVGDGHRAPHCPSHLRRSLTARDGTFLDCELGYIIKSRKPAAAESEAA